MKYLALSLLILISCSPKPQILHIPNPQYPVVLQQPAPEKPSPHSNAASFDPLPIEEGFCTDLQGEQQRVEAGILVDEETSALCFWYRVEYDRLSTENEALWKALDFYRGEFDNVLTWTEGLTEELGQSWFERNAFLLGVLSGLMLTSVTTGIIISM